MATIVPASRREQETERKARERRAGIVTKIPNVLNGSLIRRFFSLVSNLIIWTEDTQREREYNSGTVVLPLLGC